MRRRTYLVLCASMVVAADVACLYAGNGGPPHEPTPTEGNQESSTAVGSGATPEIDAIAGLLIPLPPVFEVPGTSPQLVGVEPEAQIRTDDQLNDRTVWRYVDENDPLHSAHSQRLDILMALWRSGWGQSTCQEFSWMHGEDGISDTDSAMGIRAVARLEIDCRRASGEMIRWDIIFYFSEDLSTLLTQDEVPPSQRTLWKLCSDEGCLTNGDLGSAVRIEYEIRSSTADFSEGAPIPPLSLPMQRLRFVDYEFQTTSGRWRFVDLGGWNDAVRWATIEHLMREAGYTERCERGTEDNIVIEGLEYTPEYIWGQKALACFHPDGSQIAWFVDYDFERGVSQDWNTAHSVRHTVFADRETSSGYLLLPLLREVLIDGTLPDCRTTDASMDPGERFQYSSELLDRVGYEPSNLLASYDDLLASGIEELEVTGPDGTPCSTVIALAESEDYGSLIYERDGGGIAQVLFRIPFESPPAASPEGVPPDPLRDWVNGNPWYLSLPVETEQHVVVYISDTAQFRIRLLDLSGASDEEIRRMTGLALQQLVDIGIVLDRQDYYVLVEGSQ